MPVVSDYVRIDFNDSHVFDDSGDHGIINYRVGDGASTRTAHFDTGGRHAPGAVYIIFMVKGMTATTNDAEVILNGIPIGKIFNNKGGRRDEWQTQILHVLGAGNWLNNGDNELQLKAVTYSGGGDDKFDDYYIRNMYCHFHQDV